MCKNGGNIIRYQSAFISDNEVNKLIKEIKSQAVDYLDELDEIIKIMMKILIASVTKTKH